MNLRQAGTALGILFSLGALFIGPASSCSSEPCTVWSPTADFSDPEKAQLINAVVRFDSFVGFTRFRVGPGGCPIEKKHYPVIEYDGGLELPELGGQHRRWLQRIWLSDTLNGPDLESVLMHEMGHAAGMNHLPNYAWGVMHDPPALDWTRADENECEQSSVCR